VYNVCIILGVFMKKKYIILFSLIIVLIVVILFIIIQLININNKEKFKKSTISLHSINKEKEVKQKELEKQERKKQQIEDELNKNGKQLYITYKGTTKKAYKFDPSFTIKEGKIDNYAEFFSNLWNLIDFDTYNIAQKDVPTGIDFSLQLSRYGYATNDLKFIPEMIWYKENNTYSYGFSTEFYKKNEDSTNIKSNVGVNLGKTILLYKCDSELYAIKIEVI